MLLPQNIMITMAFLPFKRGSDYFSTSVLARLSPIRYQQLWQVYLIICFIGLLLFLIIRY